ncbi:glycoside hydrolase [Microbacterium mangrovi]|uniref:Glycoside hydrolase n=1 Tax=Microbacterium mangrovi TaxID=1348253 RepID=A0A0B2AAP0_9MICO|nr:glycoside hydrolase family 3 N-terminal domain-containing protein [Microbacterium mangrovi]KHK98803.1 glycoside hydrolase [Microbacterium mangrovi]
MSDLAHAHLNTSLPVEARVDHLLHAMTLQEKCHQLVSVAPWALVNPDGSEPEALAETLKSSPGHVSNFGIDDPAELVRLVGLMQRRVIEGTRLGIPLLIHAEALNGFLAGQHMVFPTGIGLAATWSPELVEAMADIIRQQMRRAGFRQALAPVMDVALDPRWGRVHETYGEDPYLSAAMSVAYTRGLQSKNLRDGIIATAKHFLAYGLAESGVNLSGAETGARRLRDVFAFPFEAAIQDAGLASVMNGYADVDRVPVAASREILTDLLRGTLGFDGFVSSDYMTIEQMVDRQRVATTPAEAGRLAITAGLDTEFPTPFGYGDTLVSEVEHGNVAVELVDTAVRRILTAKFRVGLFENPYPAERIDVAEVAEEGRGLSQELARRSVVLAKNDGLLPLDSDRLRIAVVGPHADAVGLQFPTYTYPAFREMMTAMSSGALGNMVGADPGMARWNESLLPAVGAADYVRSTLHARALFEEVSRFASSTVCAAGSTLTDDLDSDEFDQAVNAAAEADVVVLALGGASLWFNGERTEGEGSDSADIALPAAQVRLADAVAATGTPMVVVMVQGRAYTLPDSVLGADALLISTYGGPFGPKAVADVIFGAVNPSGKLPYSIPRHTGQIPVYHHKVAGSGHRNPLPPGVEHLYLDMDASPLLPFGYGLSFTDFTLTSVQSEKSMDTHGSVQIHALATNTGRRSGVVTPQIYLRANTSGVSRPAQQLAGFARVELAPGESKQITFEIHAEQLAYTNLAREFVIEPSDVDWFIGLDSDDKAIAGAFRVEGAPRPLTSAERKFFSDVTVR